jgi:phytoene synthase
MTTSISREELNAAYKFARQIMKERAASFYQAFSKLPEERFLSVAAVYAFCRSADDIVDAAGNDKYKQEARQKLSKLEEGLKSLYKGSSSVSDYYPWWPAFADTVYKYQIHIKSFLQQIEGQRRDLDFKDIQTLEELVDYCRLVAGSVGTMLLPILADDEADTSDPGFIKACEGLGIAMQITNILRDVGEDLKLRNRIYIPADMLLSQGLTRKNLEDITLNNEAIPKSFISVWEALAQTADEYYKAYEPWLFKFHSSCQLPLTAAAMSYRAIADAVRKEDYNCFTKRCYTSSSARAKIIVEAEKHIKKLRKNRK